MVLVFELVFIVYGAINLSISEIEGVVQVIGLTKKLKNFIVIIYIQTNQRVVFKVEE